MWLSRALVLAQVCLPLLVEHFVVSCALLNEIPKARSWSRNVNLVLDLEVPGKEQRGLW